jgi:hypothetical protein
MDANRLSLIRFVTTRYRALQGFRTVSDGIFLLLMPLVFRWDGTAGRNPGAAVGSTLLFVLAASLVQQLVGTRYDRRFGRAGQVSRGDRLAGFGFFVAYAVAVIAAQLTGTPWLRGSIAAVALGAGPLLVVCRDWPHRSHWLLPVMAAVAGGALFAGVDGAVAKWCVFVWRAGGLSLIAAGLLDHALLVRFMTRDAHETPEPVQS